MSQLRRGTLLSVFNAKPYSNWGSDDDALLGDTELVNQQQSVIAINFEKEIEDWEPIAVLAEAAKDPRLPDWFLDGAVMSLEIAGSSRDRLGYPRVIRAGQMGVGLTCRHADVSNRKKFWRFVALNSSGYNNADLSYLRTDLNGAVVPHELIDWQPDNGQEQEKAFDLMSVRSLVRTATRNEMIARERNSVEEVGEPVYADGRYVDHAPDNDAFLVIGVIKSQRAQYLANRPLQVLYSLEQGQRTPAFLIERRRGVGRKNVGNQIVTFYVRLTSPDLVGPGGGLVRIELSERYFNNQVQGDMKLFDAIAADLTQLRTHDFTYARGAVTVEPIRSVERELHLIFRDTQMVAIEAMRLLQS